MEEFVINRKVSFAKKNALPITALSLVLGTLVFFLIATLGWMSSALLIVGLFGVVLSPIAGVAVGVVGLWSSIRSYRKTKDRAYVFGIVLSSIAIALPILTVLIPIILLSTGAIYISFM